MSSLKTRHVKKDNPMCQGDTFMLSVDYERAVRVNAEIVIRDKVTSMKLDSSASRQLYLMLKEVFAEEEKST